MWLLAATCLRFRVGFSTVSKIIVEVFGAIITEFEPEVLQTLSTVQEWQAVAQCFERRWNLPHCKGALDGKHRKLSKLSHSGSLYFNYTKFFSIILMTLVNANYEFLWVNADSNGAYSDAQIYNGSNLCEAIVTKAICWPASEPLKNYDNDRRITYFIIRDDAFALKPWLLKPYSKPVLVPGSSCIERRSSTTAFQEDEGLLRVYSAFSLINREC